MATKSYIPRWLKVRTGTGTVGAIGFVADRAYEHYSEKLSLDETARIIATASGKLGTCLDYLRSILDNLNKCGITDKPLQNLLALAEHKSSREV
jgi:cation transport protein ChaC